MYIHILCVLHEFNFSQKWPVECELDADTIVLVNTSPGYLDSTLLSWCSSQMKVLPPSVSGLCPGCAEALAVREQSTYIKAVLAWTSDLMIL